MDGRYSGWQPGEDQFFDNHPIEKHLFAREDKALYLAGILLQDIQLHISPPNNGFCLLPEGREKFGYLERTSVEMVACIHGPLPDGRWARL
jgi:hypothetical protein